MSKANIFASACVGTADDLPSQLAGLRRPLAVWRGLFFDLPLIWAMELSQYAGHLLQAQADHIGNLSACSDFQELVAQHNRFAERSIAELIEEAEALAREAQIVVAAA